MFYVLAFLGTLLLMYFCNKLDIAWPISLMGSHAQRNAICVPSSNPALCNFFEIGLDWIGLLKLDYSYLIKYTWINNLTNLTISRKDPSKCSCKFKTGSIQSILTEPRHTDGPMRPIRIGPSMLPLRPHRLGPRGTDTYGWAHAPYTHRPIHATSSLT